MIGEKKAEERFFIDRFVAGVGLDFKIEPGEVPDFRLGYGTAHVGLEVTRIFHPPLDAAVPRKAIESLRERVIREAQSSYERGNHPPVWVFLFFNPSKPFGKSDVGRLSNSLCQLVRRNLPKPGFHNEEDYNWLNREWFPEEFDHIRVSRTSSLARSFWSAPDDEYIPACAPALIQETIYKKARRFDAYAATLQECWLLIVADDFSLSGLFELAADTLVQEYTSPFTRVYLLRAMSSRVYRLNVCAVPPTA